MKKLIIVLFLVMAGMQYSRSQSDTILVSEEQVNRSDEKYDRVYKLFIEDRDREIKHLWKLNLLQLTLIQPNVGFEQRIGQKFSSETYILIGFPNHWQSGYLGGYAYQYFNLLVTQQLRFYYNYSRRENLGKITNGFSGNYFACELHSGYGRYIDNSIFDTSFGISENQFGYGFGFYYGLQRRIGNIGYFDCFAGLKIITSLSGFYSDGYYGIPHIGIRAGFAIDSFKNLKRMLK